ncbi:MAG: glycine cleavage system H protein [Planctomycetota bacterium]|jgi:glycine cleavage system H protein
MRPDDRKYTKSHEWIKIDGDTAIIGITDFAVDKLCSGNEGDLVYCDLPEPGRELETSETFGEIESVKSVSDLDAPIAGSVVETNILIEEHLEILCTDPWDKGWLLRIKYVSDDLGDLMDAAEYEEMVSKDDH